MSKSRKYPVELTYEEIEHIREALNFMLSFPEQTEEDFLTDDLYTKFVVLGAMIEELEPQLEAADLMKAARDNAEV